MRRILTFVPLLALAACGNPDTPGGRAADARHESFEALGDAMKTAGDALKASPADLATLRAQAVKINDAAIKLPTWFPAGSGPQDGLKTDSLEAVWTKPAEFKQASDKFIAAAASFQTLTQGSDMAAIGGGMKALGDTCKGCHEKFKKDD